MQIWGLQGQEGDEEEDLPKDPNFSLHTQTQDHCRHEPRLSFRGLGFWMSEILEDKVMFAFPLATENTKPPFSQFVASCYLSRDNGKEGEGEGGGEKGSNLQLALQSGMQRMHKQPRSAPLR